MIAGSVAALAVLGAAAAGRGLLARARGAQVARRLAAASPPCPVGPRPAAAVGARPARPPSPWRRPPAWFETGVERAALGVDPVPAWFAVVAGHAGAVALVTVAAGPALGGLAAVTGAVALPVALRLGSGRADGRDAAVLPLALELVARSLRSGASLGQAIAEAGAATPGRLGADLAALAEEVRLGRGLVDALEGWGARRHAVPGVALAVAALTVAAETGGARARAIDGLAVTLRDRLDVAGELRALTSQARLSALVLTVAPLAFAVFAAVADPKTGRFLSRTPLGLALVAAGLGLDALGALWMRRLTAPAAAGVPR